MSLINCPECTKKISDQAEKCPECGFIMKNSNRQKPSLAVKILAAIFGLIGLFVLISGIMDMM